MTFEPMTSSECQSLDSAQGYQTQYRLREYFGSYCTVPIKVLLVARILAISVLKSIEKYSISPSTRS